MKAQKYLDWSKEGCLQQLARMMRYQGSNIQSPTDRVTCFHVVWCRVPCKMSHQGSDFCKKHVLEYLQEQIQHSLVQGKSRCWQSWDYSHVDLHLIPALTSKLKHELYRELPMDQFEGLVTMLHGHNDNNNELTIYRDGTYLYPHAFTASQPINIAPISYQN